LSLTFTKKTVRFGSHLLASSGGFTCYTAIITVYRISPNTRHFLSPFAVFREKTQKPETTLKEINNFQTGRHKTKKRSA